MKREGDPGSNHPFSKFLNTILRTLRTSEWGKQISGERLEKKKQRFWAVGAGLAEEIEAFDKLGFETEEERKFFVERLYVYLYHSLWPLIPTPEPKIKEVTLNRKDNSRQKDENLDGYFWAVFTLTSPSSLEKAMDNAAREAFFVIANNLKNNESLSLEFTQDVIKSFKNGKTAPLLTTLFQVDPDVKETLEFGFQRNREEIAGFRQTVTKVFKSDETDEMVS